MLLVCLCFVVVVYFVCLCSFEEDLIVWMIYGCICGVVIECIFGKWIYFFFGVFYVMLFVNEFRFEVMEFIIL